MATLRIEPREGPAYTMALGTEEVTIGRGAGNTLHVRDPWLSRVHARIVWRSGEHELEDAGSRNGTYLNGRQVAAPSRLLHGDQIALGDLLINYLTDATAPLEVADSKVHLGAAGTVMISSDELNLARYRESLRKRAQAEHMVDVLLPTLNEVASALISHVPLAELVDKVLDMVLAAVPAERGALMLRAQRGGGDLEVRSRRGYQDDRQVRISRTIVDVVCEERQAILTVDAQADERFDNVQSIMLQGIRSVLCVPLVGNQSQVIGLLYLDDRIANEVFSESILRLVGLIANLAAVKIENCWLLDDQIEKRRMEEELAVGAKIQRALLPTSAPVLAGYDIRGVNRSCYEIGGDYFDFLPKGDGKLAIVIADISGKGVPAALLMAALQASLRALMQAFTEPSELIARLNRVLVENSPDNKFATVFYGEIDPHEHVLEYVSGGHNPTLLWRPGAGVDELGSTGPIVGLVPGARFHSRRVELPPGAALLFYTDGVTELRDDQGEELGQDRLVHLLAAHPQSDAHDLIDVIHATMQEFAHGDRFDDDTTLVAVRRLATVASPAA